MKPIRYVNKRMMVAINQLCIGMSGGARLAHANIREGQSLGFVERIFENSIFGEPIYPDIFHQAGAYMFYILKNHTFHDGNKRTGLAVAVAFLEWNHIQFVPFAEDEVFAFVMDVAGGPNDPETVIPQIAHWFRSMSFAQNTGT